MHTYSEHAHARIHSCRACLDQLTEMLIERERIDGKEVRDVVEASAAPEDLAVRRESAGLALL